jgi:hypothetical protein
VAALADHDRSFACQVKVIDVEGENLIGPGGCFVEHPPQGLLTQPDVGARPEGVEVVVRDRFGLIPRYSLAVDRRHRIPSEPVVAPAVADKRLQSGDAGVPRRRRCVSPSLIENPANLRGGELAD